jgi:RNA polymerase sigma-70 factor (ECF subfamily)
MTTDELLASLQANRAMIEDVASAILRNHSDAPDIYQETCIKALRSKDSFDPARGAIESWLLTIAKRAALDLYRKISRRSKLMGNQELIEGEGAAHHRLGAEEIQEALAGLSPKHRDILTEYYTCEKSARELAAEKGVNVTAVKAKIHRAKVAFAKIFNHRGHREHRGVGQRENLT